MTLPPIYRPEGYLKIPKSRNAGQAGGRVKFFILLMFLSLSLASAEDITLPPDYRPEDDLKIQKFRNAEQSGGRVKSSTSSYKKEQKKAQSNGGSLILNLEKTRHDSIASLDYSVRWDFSDIASFNIFSKKFYSSLNPIGGWDITDNTKFKMHGFSMNPWRIIIEKKEEPVRGSDIFVKEESAGVSSRRYKKKVRFSLYPIYNELTKDMESQIRDMLLKESFKGRLPGWEGADKKTKRLFINDLLFVDEVWDIPVINETKGGLEYLGSEEEKKKE